MDLDNNKMVTIHIDGTFHAAMKETARRRKVLISLLYEQAVEAFLEAQNKHVPVVKKTKVSMSVSR